ncbi:hypothetical protein, partial [Sphingomonas sp. RIT328]|uniref:hypothetical protein n=1 Tax=Sphingomonas sp. RIT328 TaxID=1470591 RepID=UPI001F265699
VLGMPPAFVLSHDQTLKFMTPSTASGITSGKQHIIEVTCSAHYLQDARCSSRHTKHPITNGYVKDIQNRLSFETIPDASITPDTDKPPPACPFIKLQCQRADKNTGASSTLFVGG